MKTITFASLKGGTGKSTLAIATAMHLKQQGQKVLFVDSDPNPSSTKFFQPQKIQSCALAAALNGSQIKPEDTTSGIALLSSTLHLLNLGTCPTAIIKEHLNSYSEQYDIAIIDTPPTYNNLVRAAYFTADIICIPTLIDSFSHQATTWLLSELASLQIAAAIQITLNQFSPSKSQNENVWANREASIFLEDQELKDYIGDIYIPKSSTLHRLIAEEGYYPKGKMAQTIASFCQELLN